MPMPSSRNIASCQTGPASPDRFQVLLLCPKQILFLPAIYAAFTYFAAVQ